MEELTKEYIERLLDDFIKIEYRGNDHVLARTHYRDVFYRLIPKYFTAKEKAALQQKQINGENKMSEKERPAVEDRAIDAPLHSFSIADEIERLKNESSWSSQDRNAITLQKDDNLRVVMMSLHKGTVIDEHKAEGAITLFVVSGKINFTADQKTVTVQSHGLLVLDKPIVHRVEALEETHFVLTIIRKP